MPDDSDDNQFTGGIDLDDDEDSVEVVEDDSLEVAKAINDALSNDQVTDMDKLKALTLLSRHASSTDGGRGLFKLQCNPTQFKRIYDVNKVGEGSNDTMSKLRAAADILGIGDNVDILSGVNVKPSDRSDPTFSPVARRNAGSKVTDVSSPMAIDPVHGSGGQPNTARATNPTVASGNESSPSPVKKRGLFDGNPRKAKVARKSSSLTIADVERNREAVLLFAKENAEAMHACRTIHLAGQLMQDATIEEQLTREGQINQSYLAKVNSLDKAYKEGTDWSGGLKVRAVPRRHTPIRKRMAKIEVERARELLENRNLFMAKVRAKETINWTLFTDQENAINEKWDSEAEASEMRGDDVVEEEKVPDDSSNMDTEQEAKEKDGTEQEAKEKDGEQGDEEKVPDDASNMDTEQEAKEKDGTEQEAKEKDGEQGDGA